MNTPEKVAFVSDKEQVNRTMSDFSQAMGMSSFDSSNEINVFCPSVWGEIMVVN